MPELLLLIVVMPVVVAVGMTMCVAGRLGLRQLADGSYRGSAWSWFGFLGGLALTILGIAAETPLVVWVIITR